MPEMHTREERPGTATGQSLDSHWMRQALQLAEQSVGMASPNPQVGCVLVRNGVAVGRGAHHYDRRDHAEVVALAEAGGQARGCTAYVTLEPCAHTGRTPPCAEALIHAGVGRVVVATGDPNPLVNGKGLALLRAAGISVTTGICVEQARALNDGFARWVRTRLPFVTLKAGLSLDGRIAPGAGAKTAGGVDYLTGARSLVAVQKLRHAADAVLTGVGTVLADNPLLTDRSGTARRRPLLRVVLDSALRLPLTSRLVETAANDLLVCTADGESGPERQARWQALETAGVQVRAVGGMRYGPARGLHLLDVFRLLAESYGVLNLLTEGGSRLNRGLLAGAPLADKLCLFYAPMFLGDEAVPLLGGSLPVPLEVHRSTLSESGSDFRLDAYLRDPWRES